MKMMGIFPRVRSKQDCTYTMTVLITSDFKHVQEGMFAHGNWGQYSSQFKSERVIF